MSYVGADAPEWTEGDSAFFAKYSYAFVPSRAEQMDIVTGLLPTHERPWTAVELCCGEGLLSRRIADRHPNAQLACLDGSSEMLRVARNNLEAYADGVEFSKFDLAQTSWRRRAPWADAFVSSLAIHHLDDAEKEHLYADLFEMLHPGGVVVIADLVAPASPRGVAVAADEWDEAVRTTSLATLGDLRAFNEFEATEWNYFRLTKPDPIDKPSRLLDQLKWLERAGFREVDVFWMRAGHAIFGGTKPAAL